MSSSPRDSAAPERTPPETRVLTPSQLNAEAQVVLEESFGHVWLEGEISNLARPGSGHWYFSLKDSRAQVRCAMFRNRNMRIRFQPENGLQILVRGRVSLYVGRGEFQVVVDHMEPAGEGALRLAFEQLRARLEAEGLFAEERKRPLPALTRHIAVITSPTGAAIRDILTVLARRWPAALVTLLPSAVQGEAAPGELRAALARLARWHEADSAAAPDVVIIGRGGGSLEDLWAFNDEALARAIAACPMPVISAVGHEVDVTISDLVADLRAPTPSAAAELAVPDAADWLASFRNFEQQLSAGNGRHIRRAQEHLRHLSRRLRHPGALLRERSQRLDELELRARRQVTRQLARAQEGLRNLERRQANAGPGRRLERGRETLAGVRRRLQQLRPTLRIAREREHLQSLEQRLRRGTAMGITRAQERHQRLVTTLNAFNPLGVVERGYAIVGRPAEPGVRFGDVIRDPAAVAPGETLHAHLAAGVLQVTADGPVAEEDGG